MKMDFQELRLELCKKLLSYETDHYNENTYNFSQGYKRCLVDLIRDLDSKNE